jgi:hypothetical protein
MKTTIGQRGAGVAAMALALVLGNAGASPAQTIVPPFDTDYSAVILGPVPGVPTNYGGLTFADGDPDTILIGGSANNAAGNLYSIGVVRDGTGHITGFTGTAQVFATAAYNDGGVTYGPSGVLFLARWPVNELGQVKPGSSTTDKIIDMGQFGEVSSLAAMAFVPAGFPGAGHFKLVTYSSGDWYDATLASDGAGTFDVTGLEHRAQIAGGPEGFVYLPPASPQFHDYSSMLVAEYGNGEIVAYDVDANGDPIPATRTDFLTGLTGAEGAVVDPLTGDFLFSTFGSSNQVVAVHGFGVPTGCAACATGPGCTDTCDQETNGCRTCGHPFSNGRCVVNAVVVLQGALDIRACEACLCDVDLSGAVTATDALTVLMSCAGLDVSLQCAVQTAVP